MMASEHLFIDRLEKAHAQLQAELDRADSTISRLREALGSIARNTCCDKCQEAALVARTALKEGEM